MSNVLGIHSVGQSLMTRLTNTYPASLRALYDCTFSVLSSTEVAEATVDLPAVTLYLHRVSMNEHMRSMRRGPERPNDANPLSLDLHYLLSVWAATAPAEHTLLAWTMRELHLQPLLDSSSLSSDAEWLPNEFIEIVPAEMPTDEIMRIWEAFSTPYRLSVSYTARILRISGNDVPPGRPVIARRIDIQDHVPVTGA